MHNPAECARSAADNVASGSRIFARAQFILVLRYCGRIPQGGFRSVLSDEIEAHTQRTFSTGVTNAVSERLTSAAARCIISAESSCECVRVCVCVCVCVWRRVECREGEHEVEPIFARFLLSRSFPFTQRPPFSPRSLVPRRVRRTARHVQAVPGRGRLQPGSR